MKQLFDYRHLLVSKNFILVAIFFAFTPITLAASILSLTSLENKSTESSAKPKPVEYQKALVYSSSSSKSIPNTTSQVIAGDARPQIVREYLEKSGSELTPFADKIVETADKYGLDYRLIPAIAQKESGLCRRIPPGSHNCWGWGIHSAGTLGFENYDEAIEVVSKGLREKYLDQGYVTPDQIMKKYAHPDSTTWAEGVNFYMAQME
jgi:hypothetical protein